MKYLYYKLWQQFKRVKTNDMPATNAMIFLTIWQFLNLFVIYVLINHYFIGGVKLELKSTSEIFLFAGFFYSILTLINYFVLYKNRESISARYINEGKIQAKTGNILLVLYIVLSFALVFYFGSKLS